jgi:hypothetical protein
MVVHKVKLIFFWLTGLSDVSEIVLQDFQIKNADNVGAKTKRSSVV